jgi:transposase
MSKGNTVAVDLAKSVFQVCILSEQNQVVKSLRLSRPKFKEFLTTHEPSQIFMEACYSSHYWGRYAQQAGHHVGLIPAQHVTPFVRGNKNDRNDALAIAEAARRPGMRMVPVKAESQLDIQVLHRIRERCVAIRTGLMNQMRGLLSDYGYSFPEGIKSLAIKLRETIENPALSAIIRKEIEFTLVEYDLLSRRLEHLRKTLADYTGKNEDCQYLQTIPGIGPHIASAIVSTIGKGQAFSHARAFAVWTGLTPIQKASGNKSIMAGISKRGNRYLRKQFVQAARHTVRWAKRQSDTKLGRWINQIVLRRGLQKGVVAVAHKLARISWILLQKSEKFNAA